MWLAADPVDMRAGADRLIARVVEVFSAAQAHHGYLFANARRTRMKLVVHDGFGVWRATRRLNQGRLLALVYIRVYSLARTRLSASADAEPVPACSRCMTRTARSCWARRCCTPTRRR